MNRNIAIAIVLASAAAAGNAFAGASLAGDISIEDTALVNRNQSTEPFASKW